MRRGLAALAVVAAVLFPGCTYPSDVIVVAGRDDAGVPVAGAAGCARRDDPAELTVTTGRDRLVRTLDHRSRGPARLGRVPLVRIPEPVDAPVVLRARRYEDGPGPVVETVLDLDAGPGTYRVASEEGGAQHLDEAAALEWIDDTCSEDIGPDLRWLVVPTVVVVSLGLLFVLGCVVAAFRLGRRPRRQP